MLFDNIKGRQTLSMIESISTMLHDFETDGRYTPLLFKNIKNFQNILFPIRNSRNFCTVAPKQITRERVNISSLSAYSRQVRASWDVLSSNQLEPM